MTHSESLLLTLLKECCLLKKDVELSCGERSSHYIDVRNISCSSLGATLIGSVLYERTSPLIFDAIGGMAMGAIPLVTATSITYQTKQPNRIFNSFWIRDVAKPHGTNKQIEGVLERNNKVVLIEDVTTSGQSLMKAVKAVRDYGAIVTLAISLVDRDQGAGSLLASEGVRLDSVFAVDDLAADATEQEK